MCFAAPPNRRLTPTPGESGAPAGAPPTSPPPMAGARAAAMLPTMAAPQKVCPKC